MDARDPPLSDDAPPLVVAFSGPSGAGKSALIHKVAAGLGGAARLHFDDYVTLGTDITLIRDWLERGAPPDAIAAPGLARDLAHLAAGRPLPALDGRAAMPAHPVILVEEPFGRARGEMAALVHLAVHLDVPADVALARRLLRAVDEGVDDPAGPDHAALTGAMAGQLRAFLAAGRDAYAAADRVARAAADLTLDGLLPLDTLAARLLTEIGRRRAAPMTMRRG